MVLSILNSARARSGLLLILAVGLTGCLPSSCRRDEPRAVFPSDSLSRRIAEQVPVDTLELVRQVTASEVPGLTHPRTVRFGHNGRVYVSDTERHQIYVFDTTGAFAAEIASPDFKYPYLAGLRGDTLLVFNPEARRIDFVVDGVIADRIETPADLPGTSPLQYVAVSDEAIFFKTVAEDAEGYVARLNRHGEVVAADALSGPYWRYAGLLRTWGDTLLSLSGYRPVVDILAPGRRLDTLALAGFDSPMLARSRSFVRGEVKEAPLLSASAAPAGDFLFVLNMRPGWLRVDAYDRSGRLRRVLTQQDPQFNRAYYPIDLDVRRTASGVYEIAVASVRPRPAVSVYRWQP